MRDLWIKGGDQISYMNGVLVRPRERARSHFGRRHELKNTTEWESHGERYPSFQRQKKNFLVTFFFETRCKKEKPCIHKFRFASKHEKIIYSSTSSIHSFLSQHLCARTCIFLVIEHHHRSAVHRTALLKSETMNFYNKILTFFLH